MGPVVILPKTLGASERVWRKGQWQSNLIVWHQEPLAATDLDFQYKTILSLLKLFAFIIEP